MTNDTGDKSSGPKQGRRPGPTIELKATEVASAPVADQRSDETPQKAASKERAEEPHAKAESKPEPAKTESKSSLPPRGPDQPKRPFWGQLPGGLSLSLVGTAAAAGIVFFLLGLATANLFVGREIAADARLARAQTVDDLSERLAKIETALAAARAPDAALTGRIAAAEAAAKLATEQAAVQQRRTEEVAALARDARSRADAAATSAEAAQKSGAVAPDGVRVDVDALNQRIAALEQALKTNEAELTRRITSDDRKSRTAVTASILLNAVERGAPFTAELAAAKALTADAGALAPLDAFAATGVPGAVALARELSGMIPAMLKVIDSETKREGGFLDKLQANAERLVRIRPVGEVAGDRPIDVLARIEAKANASDIAGALDELAKLPAQVRAPADGWIKKANARNAALTAARQLSVGALAALGKPNT